MQGRRVAGTTALLSLLAIAACQQGVEPERAPSPAPRGDARSDRALPLPLQTFVDLMTRAPAPRDRLTAAIAIESVVPPADALPLLRPALADASPAVRLAALAYVARLASRVDLQPSIRYELGDGLVETLAASPAERDAAYAVLVRVSGQDFAASNREAWRTWLAPPTAPAPDATDG